MSPQLVMRRNIFEIFLRLKVSYLSMTLTTLTLINNLVCSDVNQSMSNNILKAITKKTDKHAPLEKRLLKKNRHIKMSISLK